MNRVMLIDRLEQDPELRFAPSGSPLAKITLAIDQHKLNGEERPADSRRTAVWSKLAQMHARYLTQNEQDRLRGRIEYGMREIWGETRNHRYYR